MPHRTPGAETMKLIIDDVPESLNKTLRMHWAARNRYNTKWYALVRQQYVPVRKKPGKMDVVISQMRKKLLDRDNLFGSCKPVVDGMVRAGILRDDSPAWLNLECRQMAGKIKMTIIDVEPCAPPR
jgi:hypothetical protein